MSRVTWPSMRVDRQAGRVVATLALAGVSGDPGMTAFLLTYPGT